MAGQQAAARSRLTCRPVPPPTCPPAPAPTHVSSPGSRPTPAAQTPRATSQARTPLHTAGGQQRACVQGTGERAQPPSHAPGTQQAPTQASRCPYQPGTHTPRPTRPSLTRAVRVHVPCIHAVHLALRPRRRCRLVPQLPQLLPQVPHLHLRCVSPGGRHVRLLRAGAHAVDAPRVRHLADVQLRSLRLLLIYTSGHARMPGRRRRGAAARGAGGRWLGWHHLEHRGAATPPPPAPAPPASDSASDP